MRHVYAGYLSLLKTGGILAAVVQPVRDRHRLLPLHHETARLLAALGFEFLDEVTAVLGRVVLPPHLPEREPPLLVAHTSYGRRRGTARLRERGFPLALGQTETVLVFRKSGLPSPTRRRAP